MTGLLSLVLKCAMDEKDMLIAELYSCGTTGIVEREEPGAECTVEAFFETGREASEAAGHISRYHPELVQREQRDYVQDFEDQWQPLLIGTRLWLAPPWHSGPPPQGRLRIDYQPGMACGSGMHPCTQLCLAALEEVVPPGARVVDVGVGSGILLLAAKSLGAALTAGCDIDCDSVVIAKQTVPEALLCTGSASCFGAARFDVVCANISSAAVDSILPELRRVMAPGGALVLSGFRVDDLPRGLENAPIRTQEGWACAVIFF